jgi:alkylhydroperoxidase family enzyme
MHRSALGNYAHGSNTTGLYKTCLRAANFCTAWVAFAAHVDGATSTLTARERELLILRTASLNRDNYTWGEHRRQALRAGLREADIRRTREASDAKGWSGFDQTLLRLARELSENQFVEDRTWRELSARYGDQQLLDAVLTVGAYTAVAMFVNGVGIPAEPG